MSAAMRSTVRGAALTVFLLAACRDASNPLQPGSTPSRDLVSGSRSSHVIPGQYIVVFKRDVNDADASARSLVALYGGSLRYVYTSALHGFAANPSESAAAARRPETPSHSA